MTAARPSLLVVLALAAAALALPAAAAFGQTGARPRARAPMTTIALRRPTPARASRSPRLRCPDLIMRCPPARYFRRSGSRMFLHAGNSIVNVGQGPAEVFGRRSAPSAMRVTQRISRVAAAATRSRRPARLSFKFIPGQYGPTGSSKTPPASRSGPSMPSGRLGRHGPHRAQADLLPARPRQARNAAVLAAQPRIPRLQPGRHAAARSRSAPRWAGPTSTPPPTTSSTSSSPVCAGVSSSSSASTRSTASASPTRPTTSHRACSCGCRRGHPGADSRRRPSGY